MPAPATSSCASHLVQGTRLAIARRNDRRNRETRHDPSSLSAPYDGSTAPVFLGLQRGFYEQVGLRCQFDTSGGAVEAIGRLNSGVYDSGAGDINVPMDFIG